MRREVAWRMFADEFRKSSFSRKEEDEYAPNYIVSPLGAVVNRVFVVGVVTDIEEREAGENTFWQARISDPTGVWYLNSGQFQPEVSRKLEEMQEKIFTEQLLVATVAKTRSYTNDEGTVFNSLRPETLDIVDDEARKEWLLDTIESTGERIASMRLTHEMQSPSVEELVKKGVARKLAEGSIEAQQHYSEDQLKQVEDLVLKAIHVLKPSTTTESAPATPAEGGGAAPVATDNEARRQEILGYIGSLDGGGEGADIDAIIELAMKGGMVEADVDDLITELLDDGVLYEPSLGKVRHI